MSDEQQQRPPPHWWMQNAERRLDGLQSDQANLWKDLREDVRRGDRQADMLTGHEDRIKDLRKDVEEIERRLREEFLSKKDFAPYRNGVVALVTGVGMAMLGGILKLLGLTPK